MYLLNSSNNVDILQKTTSKISLKFRLPYCYLRLLGRLLFSTSSSHRPHVPLLTSHVYWNTHIFNHSVSLVGQLQEMWVRILTALLVAQHMSNPSSQSLFLAVSIPHLSLSFLVGTAWNTSWQVSVLWLSWGIMHLEQGNTGRILLMGCWLPSTVMFPVMRHE